MYYCQLLFMFKHNFFLRFSFSSFLVKTDWTALAVLDQGSCCHYGVLVHLEAWQPCTEVNPTLPSFVENEENSLFLRRLRERGPIDLQIIWCPELSFVYSLNCKRYFSVISKGKPLKKHFKNLCALQNKISFKYLSLKKIAQIK